MNILQVKSSIGIPSLQLNTASNADGEATDWMRHWDNDRRIAVSIHKDLVAELQKDKAIKSLGIQTSEKEGAEGLYTSHRIVKYAEAEVTI